MPCLMAVHHRLGCHMTSTFLCMQAASGPVTKKVGQPALSASLQGMMHNHYHHAQEGCTPASMLDRLMCKAGVL